ncbi:MAG: ArsR family transcriptional regulator [Candidatus Thorarchaeota archaeon]
MNPSEYDSGLSELFTKAARLAEEELIRKSKGLECDPCDPLLPLKHGTAFFGREANQNFELLVAEVFRFLKDPAPHYRFLIGPQGSGKTIFSRICTKYFHQKGYKAKYQDLKTLFGDLLPNQVGKEPPLEETEENNDVIFYDNAFVIHQSLPDLLSMEGAGKSQRTKVCLLMNLAEWEAYRRHCIVKSGNRSYQFFTLMPGLTSPNIKDLIKSRLQVCSGDEVLSVEFRQLLEIIPPLAHGNPGLAVRLLEEAIKFSSTKDDLRISLSVDLETLTELSGTKIPLVREILVREAQNEIWTAKERTYLQNRDLVDLLQKSKGTISHHLRQLVQQNIIYEQPMKDGREKAYRPNNTLFGLLEHYTFQSPYDLGNLSHSLEGISHEE